MRADRHFPAALLQITNQLFARFELRACRLIAVEIAHQTDAETDIVHVIAVDMAAAHLPHPTIADFDLTVAGGGPIPDDKMIGETVPHPADVAMIIIENARASLPRPAVVHDDEFPARALHRRPTDRLDVRAG